MRSNTVHRSLLAIVVGVLAASGSLALLGVASPDGEQGVYARKGLAGGQTYIRRSAWESVICWVDAAGGLGCWPPALPEHPDFPDGEFATVRVGRDHLCARRTDGEVVCWGWGDCAQGECASPDGRFFVVRAGPDANCARASDGQVECWGEPAEL